MAFYISHIDDDGRDIDCFSVGSTVRTSRTSTGTSRTSSTSRTVVPAETSRTMVATSDATGHIGDRCHTPRFMNEFYGPDDLISNSGETTLREQYTCRSNDDIVPPLDLRSEMDLSLEAMPTFSCQKAKLISHNDSKTKTYKKWLEKKLESQVQEAARRKKEEERRKQEQEERRQLAEEKYQIWLAKKRQANSTKKQMPNASKTTRSSSSLSSSSLSTSSSSVVTASKVTAAAAAPDPEKQRKIEEWQRAKRKQVEERRLREKKEAEERAKMEAKRKEESVAAYEHWVKRNKNRPKPVPMNQGILSLRGTISDIYVNPNEWQSILD